MARPTRSPRGATQEEESRLISVREAAAVLGVHEHTVRSWVRKGIIRAIHLPGSNYCRFRLQEVHRVRMAMEGKDAGSGVRIEEPQTDPQALEEARRLHEEVMALLAEHPPEESLEDVMTRLRGRPWSS